MFTGSRWTWGAINVERRRLAEHGGSVAGARLKGAGARCDRLGSSAGSRDLAGGWARQRAATDRTRRGAGLLAAGIASGRWEKGKASSGERPAAVLRAALGEMGPWGEVSCYLTVVGGVQQGQAGSHRGEGSDAAIARGATSMEETEAATDGDRGINVGDRDIFPTGRGSQGAPAIFPNGRSIAGSTWFAVPPGGAESCAGWRQDHKGRQTDDPKTKSHEKVSTFCSF